MEDWSSRSTPAPLEAGDVHVWAVDLDGPGARRERLAQALAPDERSRASRFQADRDRDRYVTARGALRALLGGYVGAPAPSLAFTYAPHGKPALAPPGHDLHFNLAHADALALIAVTRTAPVGVDLEALRPLDDADDIAAGHFAVDEQRALAGLAPGQALRAFYTTWTRKEAFVKAIGDGLACPLSCFSVAVGDGDLPRVLSINGDRDAAARWTLVHLEPQAGFVGALAVPAPVHTRCFRWIA